MQAASKKKRDAVTKDGAAGCAGIGGVLEKGLTTSRGSWGGAGCGKAQCITALGLAIFGSIRRKKKRFEGGFGEVMGVRGEVMF